MGLNAKQALFVEAYLRLNNATQAAIEAGYSKRTAGSYGHDLLKNPEIASRIRERTAEVLKSRQMDADEVLARLADIARGAMPIFANVDDKGHVHLRADDVEIARANLHLVKKIVNAPTEFGMKHEIEVYDAQSALVTLGKHLGLFVERREVTGADGDALIIRIVREGDDA